MTRLPVRAWLTLALALLLPLPLFPSDKQTQTDAAEKEAREIVARFNKGFPDWKVRMEALVKLARLGPTTGPVLVEALQKGSYATREIAAQALVHFAEPKMEPMIRPALEKALDDPYSGVRIYAIQALSMFGPLPRTERHEQMMRKDPSEWGVRPMMIAALARDDKPDAAALRQTLAEYDLAKLDSARVGEMAPDFSLSDAMGKTYRLSEFRGKQVVVLRFILFDF